jgi:hypothetical protein
VGGQLHKLRGRRKRERFAALNPFGIRRLSRGGFTARWPKLNRDEKRAIARKAEEYSQLFGIVDDRCGDGQGGEPWTRLPVS